MRPILNGLVPPPVEGASASAVYVIHIKKLDAGINLEASSAFTDSSSDKWFVVAKRTAGDTAVGGGGSGRQEIKGGTGKYEGVRGTCEYTVSFLADSKTVSRGTCQWQRN